MSLVTWAVITVLILINALYVAAEFAAVSVRVSRIRRLADEGDGLSRRLMPVLGDGAALDRYIATCQVGITVSSLLLGAVAQATLAVALTPVLVAAFDLSLLAAASTAATTVLIGLTGLQVVFGELVPKSLALQYPTNTSRYTIIPTVWSMHAMGWFITLLNGSGAWLLRLLRLPVTGHRHVHSPEEIELLIADSRDGGLLEPEEQRWLRQALRFSARPVRHLMVPRTDVVAVDADAPIADILAFVSRTPFTRLPVYRGRVDEIVGVLHAKQLMQGYVLEGDALRLDAALQPAVFVPETMFADALLELLRAERTHMAFVVDEFGGLTGMLTIGDVLADLLGPLDGQRPERKPERLPEGGFRLPGHIRLDGLADAVGWTWVGDAETVGGLVTAQLGRMPVKGDQLSIEGRRVEVEAATPRTVLSLVVGPAGSGRARG